MPYNKITELPDSVRDNLPKHAQKIYKEAYNSAWDQYKDPEDRQSIGPFSPEHRTLLRFASNQLSDRAHRIEL